MKWISVKDALPEDGQAVLVRYAHDNWLRTHTLANGDTRLNWRWQAAAFVRGRTASECKAMNLYRGQDQHANNLVPYRWEQFGPGDLFGQDVSHWAAITDPLQPNTKLTGAKRPVRNEMTNEVERVVMCGCGGLLRYSHIQPDGSEKMSCNKYAVCMTWNEQQERITELSRENAKMKSALQKIVNVNACDYEYRTWAKEGLDT